MAITLQSLRRKSEPKPPIMVIFGTHGCGKTTLAAGAPDPVVAAIEDGLGRLDAPSWGVKTYAEMMEAIGVLYSEEHDRKTLVVDSLDWLETLVWSETCRQNAWQNMESADYGKAYVAADKLWTDYLDGIKALRDEKNMTIVQIAHEQIVRFNSPTTEPYDRHTIKLHKRASALVQEHADIIGFMGYRVSIQESRTATQKAGQGTKRGVGGGQRVLHLEERPAFIAKNRFGMPTSIDLPTQAEAWKSPETIWASFAQHLPTATNVDK